MHSKGQNSRKCIIGFFVTTRANEPPPYERLRALANYKINLISEWKQFIKLLHPTSKCTLSKGQNSRKFISKVCFSTYRYLSLGSLPKVSTDPLKSLSDKYLCAKCVFGRDQRQKQHLAIKITLTIVSKLLRFAQLLTRFPNSVEVCWGCRGEYPEAHASANPETLFPTDTLWSHSHSNSCCDTINDNFQDAV